MPTNDIIKNLRDVTVRTTVRTIPGTLHDRCANGRMELVKGRDISTGAYVTIFRDADTGEFLRGLVGVVGVPKARMYSSERGLVRRLAELGA